MSRPFAGRLLSLALAVFAIGLLALSTGVEAQSVNPTASSVKEQQLLDALKPDQFGNPGAIQGRGSIPDQKSRTLIQPGGNDWRTFHQSTLPRVGMIAVLGVLGALVLFYIVRGKVRISKGRSGTEIVRFKAWDRFAHWLTATAFIVLALTGLNITFGKTILLPIIGPASFTALSEAGKLAHNYVSFAFMLGIVLMFVLWARDNFPALRDVVWFALGGGLIGLGHPAAARFNAGQKVIFWSVILGGVALSLSGLALMFPFQVTDVSGMQFANMVHALVGVVLVGVILAHIYIGSVGMEGAFEAMGTGKVDLNWAKDHHSIWVEREMKKGRIKMPSATPAE